MNALIFLKCRRLIKNFRRLCIITLLVAMIGAVLLLFGCKEESGVVVPDNGGGDNENPPADTDSLTLASLTKIDDYPAYTMRYYSEYSVFGDSSGSYVSGISNPGQGKASDKMWGCTCFSAFGDSVPYYFCRNFDWNYCVPLILFTDPPDGYASVSLVDLEYLGYSGNNLPDEWDKRENLLGAFQLPFDGMNEMGVTVGMMAVPSADPPYDPSKKSVGELQIIRLILDHAKNVDEAAAIMAKYNIIMDGPPIHYLIADASRHSAIVEFIAGEMVLHTNGEPWQVCTNFIITGSDAPDHVTCWRYNEVYAQLKETGGNLTDLSPMEILQLVSQTNTIWSSVYNMTEMSLDLAIGRDYGNIRLFSVRPAAVDRSFCRNISRF